MKRVSVAQLADLAEQRHRDPDAVLGRAQEIVAGDNSPEVDATARWVLALALHELGRLPEAVENYQRSISTSVEHGLKDCEAQARAGLAVSLVNSGAADEAAAEIAVARAVATPATRGVVEMLYGYVLQRTGRHSEAQVAFTRSLRILEETGPRAAIARLRTNRGILRAYQGDSEGAVEDFAAAEEVARELQLPLLIAMASHNLGFALARRGDLPESLTAFARAEQAYAALHHHGPVVAVLEADRCEVLLLAGLAAEARAAAQKAVEAAALTGDAASLTECRLSLARSLLAGGAYREASREASAVAADFRRAGRLPWAAMADYAAIQAEILLIEEQMEPPPGLLTRCQGVARELESQGWLFEAVHVRTFVGRLALAAHQPALARSELARAGMARRRGPADLRAKAWHANALLLTAEGDRAGAKRAISHGLRVVNEYLATLGGTEVRAKAAGHGSELARLGVFLALEDKKPSEVLRYADRWRAISMRYPPVRPPDDDRLAADLAELRRLRSQLRAAALDGTPTEQLQSAATLMENAVRRRLLESRGEQTDSRPLDVSRLRRALNGRAMVEFVSLEGRLHAVTLAGPRARLERLAALEEVEREQAYLMFALRRSGRKANFGASDELVSVAANRLDEMLVAPLQLPDGTPVVIVPTGDLHRLPWGCLPSLSTRDVIVAPSATAWAGGPADPHAGFGALSERVMLVAGPGLPWAEREVRQLAGLYPEAYVLTGPDATVANVLEGFGRSQLVHLAAHGVFRADSPLFSSVLLHDGPLTVYDLERVRQHASTVVLASCNAGVSSVELGEEVIGTAATLVALGARAVVAPVVAVPDRPTSVFMVAFHRGLRAGLSPSAALAASRSADETAVAPVFLCIGRDNGIVSNKTRK